MSFKNIFGNSGNEAKAAEESAQKLSEKIPGAWPEDQGVDPELYEDMPPTAARDPKIIRETSSEALGIMNDFLTPLFRNTRSAAAQQQTASEDPASTTSMASAAKDEASKNVKVEIREEDRPTIGEEEREGLKHDNYAAARSAKKRTDDESIRPVKPDDGSTR
ncbi:MULTISPECIES: hypothetical protein [Streptomyces]|uniref:hypothetical protein n=1 Tax=Streptomyces TaxID=1883 RepID=UPI0016762351|nr:MULTISPECIES: hypothetical protein [Streptomyces]MBK3525736.1 hypothetical protein [Streptomyces sp. MBT70]GGS15216.1 hypothetical protein GCM10010236_81530 [Streptomyces eurythermus]